MSCPEKIIISLRNWTMTLCWRGEQVCLVFGPRRPVIGKDIEAHKLLAKRTLYIRNEQDRTRQARRDQANAWWDRRFVLLFIALVGRLRDIAKAQELQLIEGTEPEPHVGFIPFDVAWSAGGKAFMAIKHKRYGSKRDARNVLHEVWTQRLASLLDPSCPYDGRTDEDEQRLYEWALKSAPVSIREQVKKSQNLRMDLLQECTRKLMGRLFVSRPMACLSRRKGPHAQIGYSIRRDCKVVVDYELDPTCEKHREMQGITEILKRKTFGPERPQTRARFLSATMQYLRDEMDKPFLRVPNYFVEPAVQMAEDDCDRTPEDQQFVDFFDEGDLTEQIRRDGILLSEALIQRPALTQPIGEDGVGEQSGEIETVDRLRESGRKGLATDGPVRSVTAIVGDPGSGKTSSLRWWFHRLASAYGDGKNRSLPCFIDLTDASGDPVRDIEDELKRRLPFLAAGKDKPVELALLLDGLERMQPTANRRSFIDRLQTLVVWPRVSSLTVTCTRGAWSGSYAEALEMRIMRLKPFSWRMNGQVEKYVRCRFGADSERVLGLLRSNKEIMKLGTSPLYLTLLCDSIANGEMRLPNVPAGIVAAWIQHQLPLAGDTQWFAVAGEQVLSMIAKEMLERSAWEIRRRDLPSGINREGLSWLDALDSAVRARIMVSSGRPEAGDQIRFVHRVFQEYFAALWLCRHFVECGSEDVGQYVRRHTWQRSFAMAMAITDDREVRSKMLKALLKQHAADLLGAEEVLSAGGQGGIKRAVFGTPEIFRAVIAGGNPLSPSEEEQCLAMLDSVIRECPECYFAVEELSYFRGVRSDQLIEDFIAKQRPERYAAFVAELSHLPLSRRKALGERILLRRDIDLGAMRRAFLIVFPEEWPEVAVECARSGMANVILPSFGSLYLAKIPDGIRTLAELIAVRDGEEDRSEIRIEAAHALARRNDKDSDAILLEYLAGSQADEGRKHEVAEGVIRSSLLLNYHETLRMSALVYGRVFGEGEAILNDAESIVKRWRLQYRLMEDPEREVTRLASQALRDTERQPVETITEPIGCAYAILFFALDRYRSSVWEPDEKARQIIREKVVQADLCSWGKKGLSRQVYNMLSQREAFLRARSSRIAEPIRKAIWFDPGRFLRSSVNWVDSALCQLGAWDSSVASWMGRMKARADPVKPDYFW